MKLLRYGPPGAEKPGLLDDAECIRDLSGIVADLSGEHLSREGLSRISSLQVSQLDIVPGAPRIGRPVGRVGHFIAVGLNYIDHAHETNSPIPGEPILFNKAVSSICGPDDGFMLPKGSAKTDWEVELAIVIGEGGYEIPEDQAFNHVAGYCVCQDVSERAHQVERGGQWMKGKSAPGFGPLGPWLVTKEEIADVQNLDLFLDVNGVRGNTRTMIFGVKMLVSYISRFMALEAGDVITTGTPPGVGLGMKPPMFLKAGDVVTLGVSGLGKQTQRVAARAS
ncbi:MULTISPECIES: fumarylacetoacetate hydrolase family protein [unclassified Bradyrhizobium]|uniref:fumarylacetoacetate hydrolase family protein n=1 Tax=unclassified Bradyrhizobium TaxID=2631580 RepID=UPI001FF79448|nr:MULTISPECIES: fumarylacetoacetate hydrolase family protein [unclassified Bradyrhizobium]MCK1712172.1 fumarylacetoacetate hydrolase family protein [Bradyrhizobium sp. 143]MCK1729869.1 fumarylacetoacetate hydrolase family protein [Bradyrhizobium sp. 142]